VFRYAGVCWYVTAEAEPAKPYEAADADPVKIAVIYPSEDVSDFWLRSYLAMEARFEEMGFKFEATQFASKMGDLLLQSTYSEQVARDDFEYVIFGPSELEAQQDDIKRLMDAGKKVIVLNFDTPLQVWGDDQPMMYATFSHLFGALNICNWIVENLGTEGTYAMIRGIPGIGKWLMNTMAIFSAKADSMAHSKSPRPIRKSPCCTTLTRRWPWALFRQYRQLILVSDDIGAAMAEGIRADIEGRSDDIPLVFLGRIDIVSSASGPEVVDAFEKEAFRYTGIGVLER